MIALPAVADYASLRCDMADFNRTEKVTTKRMVIALGLRANSAKLRLCGALNRVRIEQKHLQLLPRALYECGCVTLVHNPADTRAYIGGAQVKRRGYFAQLF